MQVSVSWATSGSYSGKNGSFLHVCFSAAPILQHNNFNNTKFCVVYWAADIHIPLYTMNENLLQYILFSINVFYSPFACRVELNPRDVGAGDRGRPVQCLPATRRQWTPAPRQDSPAPLPMTQPLWIIHDGRNNVDWLLRIWYTCHTYTGFDWNQFSSPWNIINQLLATTWLWPDHLLI